MEALAFAPTSPEYHRITRISAPARSMLIAWEGGLRTSAYLCAGCVPTISAGVTRYPDGRRVRMGDRIGPEQARDLFDITLLEYEADADSLTPDDLTQRQFDVVTLWLFNVGKPQAMRSTLIRLLGEGYRDARITQALKAWTKGDTDGNPKTPPVDIPGLVARRAAECLVWEHGIYTGPAGAKLGEAR